MDENLIGCRIRSVYLPYAYGAKYGNHERYTVNIYTNGIWCRKTAPNIVRTKEPYIRIRLVYVTYGSHTKPFFTGRGMKIHCQRRMFSTVMCTPSHEWRHFSSRLYGTTCASPVCDFIDTHSEKRTELVQITADSFMICSRFILQQSETRPNAAMFALVFVTGRNAH